MAELNCGGGEPGGHVLKAAKDSDAIPGQRRGFVDSTMTVIDVRKPCFFKLPGGKQCGMGLPTRTRWGRSFSDHL